MKGNKSVTCIRLALMSGLLFSMTSLAVNLERNVYVPVMEGLTITPEVTQKVVRFNPENTVAISQDGVASLFRSVNFPEPVWTKSKVHKIPQCKVYTKNRKARFVMFVNDKLWLKSQSGACRARRALFGLCKPKKASDLYKTGKIRLDSEIKITQTKTVVKDREGNACVNDPVSEDMVRLVELSTCVNMKDQSRCHRHFTGKPEAYRHFGRKFWKLTVYVDTGERAFRSNAPDREVVEKITMHLNRLEIAGLKLDKRDDGSYLNVVQLDSLLKGLSSPDRFSVKAFYMPEGDTEECRSCVLSAILNGGNSADCHKPGGACYETMDKYQADADVERRHVKMLNFPSQVALAREDVVRKDVVDAYDSEALVKAKMIISRCLKAKEDVGSGNSEFLPLGQFLCVDYFHALEQILARRVQMRIQFKDKQETMRSITWERFPRAALCEPETSDEKAFKCYILDKNGDGNIDNQEDLHFTFVNDDSQHLIRFFDDPYYNTHRMVLSSLISGIPEDSNMDPVQSFITPQTYQAALVPVTQPLSSGMRPKLLLKPAVMRLAK